MYEKKQMSLTYGNWGPDKPRQGYDLIGDVLVDKGLPPHPSFTSSYYIVCCYCIGHLACLYLIGHFTLVAS